MQNFEAKLEQDYQNFKNNMMQSLNAEEAKLKELQQCSKQERQEKERQAQEELQFIKKQQDSLVCYSSLGSLKLAVGKHNNEVAARNRRGQRGN